MSDALTLEAPQTPPARETFVPLGLLAEITHRCPLQCPYCSNPVELVRPDAELSAKEWARVFREAAALGVLQLHVSGGEPLSRPDAEEIVAAARAADLYVNLITAAVGLTEARMDALAAAGVDHVQISLQDANAAGCAAITGMRKAFEKKIAACHVVNAAGLPLTLNAVVHRHNIDHVPQMIALAVELGAHRLEVANTQYYGWAFQNRSALLPTRDQVMKAGETVAKAREDLTGTLLIDYVEPDYFGRFPKPCIGGWGREMLAVAPSGSVLPCHAAQSIPGLTFETVREHSLDDIWHRSDAFNRFRSTDVLREPCRSCAHREVDFGGCRCQAMMITGDPTNADPVCSLSPYRATLDAIREEAAGAARETPFTWRRYGERTT